MGAGLAPAGAAFRFVGRDHPHAVHLRRFRALVAQAEPYARLTDTAAIGAVTERKLLRLSADDSAELRWVSLSLQRAGGDGRFDAATFFYSTAKRRLTCFEFPADPHLRALPLVAGGRLGRRVLQFVPRRRLAYLTEDGLVAKLMRPADVAPAYERLEAVHAAARAASVTFAVAAPAGLDPEAGVFFQTCLPGKDLAASATGNNLFELLREAGAVTAELHGLAAAAPRWDQRSFRRDVRTHLHLVSLYRPREGARLAPAVERLLRELPELRRPAFCHGDLRAGHLLRHEGGWAAIDFDGCRLGDPYQDSARLLAFLKRDVSDLRERFADPSSTQPLLDDAVDAFVDGYETRTGGPLERRRLDWYLAAHELHYLARMFKRDLFEPVSFERGVERMLELARRAHRQPATVVAVGGRR